MSDEAPVEDRVEPIPGEASLAGGFEQEILDADAARLEGVWVKLQSKDRAIAGEIIEVRDGPHGTREITIELDGHSDRVKVIPLWFLDGVWEGFDADE